MIDRPVLALSHAARAFERLAAAGEYRIDTMAGVGRVIVPTQ